MSVIRAAELERMAADPAQEHAIEPALERDLSHCVPVARRGLEDAVDDLAAALRAFPDDLVGAAAREAAMAARPGVGSIPAEHGCDQAARFSPSGMSRMVFALRTCCPRAWHGLTTASAAPGLVDAIVWAHSRRFAGRRFGGRYDAARRFPIPPWLEHLLDTVELDHGWSFLRPFYDRLEDALEELDDTEDGGPRGQPEPGFATAAATTPLEDWTPSLAEFAMMFAGAAWRSDLSGPRLSAGERVDIEQRVLDAGAPRRIAAFGRLPWLEGAAAILARTRRSLTDGMGRRFDAIERVGRAVRGEERRVESRRREVAEARYASLRAEAGFLLGRRAFEADWVFGQPRPKAQALASLRETAAREAERAIPIDARLAGAMRLRDQLVEDAEAVASDLIRHGRIVVFYLAQGRAVLAPGEEFLEHVAHNGEGGDASWIGLSVDDLDAPDGMSGIGPGAPVRSAHDAGSSNEKPRIGRAPQSGYEQADVRWVVLALEMLRRREVSSWTAAVKRVVEEHLRRIDPVGEPDPLSEEPDPSSAKIDRLRGRLKAGQANEIAASSDDIRARVVAIMLPPIA